MKRLVLTVRERLRYRAAMAASHEAERIKDAAAPWVVAERIKESIEPLAERIAKTCWCGRRHRPGFWHDPTYGRIDRDIQEWTERNFPGISIGTRVAIENNAQRLRDQGLRP